MAAQVKLIEWRDLGVSAASTLDLYGFNSGFSLQRGGWLPAIAGDDDRTVIETLNLWIKGTSHDNLAAVLQNLDAMIRKAAYYNSAPDQYAIWLRTQLPNESGERQTLIRAARGELGSDLHSPPVSPGDLIRNYTLILERMPWWEDDTYLTGLGFGATVDSLGGVDAYNAIVGDMPARIAILQVSAGASGYTLTELWIGFKSSRYGTPGDFEPVWECEDGTLTNNTSSQSDGTASGGYMAQCTFATATMCDRVLISVDDVVASSADYRDQRGSYIVLLRAKVDASTTARVQLLDGISAHTNASFRTQSRVPIESTSWYLYELGTVDIPPGKNNYVPDNFLSEYTLKIQAERTAGSGDLYMDALVLIPTEGAIHVDNAMIYYGDYILIVMAHPTGAVTGWTFDTTNIPKLAADVHPINFSLPVGAGVAIVAAQRETSHVLTDSVIMNPFPIGRWRTLRGSEGT
jgi:hypothetical protein